MDQYPKTAKQEQRERFILAAMSSVLSVPLSAPLRTSEREVWPDRVAQFAVQVADATIKRMNAGN